MSFQEPVLYMKVTEALHSGDSESIKQLAQVYNIAEFPNLLHLAVELSPLDVVKFITNLYIQRHRSLNEQDKNKNTPLHIAVLQNRVDTAKHLMSLLEVTDTLTNKDGLTPNELSSTPEMEEALQTAQTKFAEQTAIKLKQAFKHRNLQQLEHIYANPRVQELLNINGFDPDTQRTVLHDACISNDVAIVKFILAHGGDPLLKDQKTHKLPEQLTTNDEIKHLLANAAKSKAILDQTTLNGKSTGMEGYLKKWTNITSGYKLRYFKILNSELVYYKKPEDAKLGDKLIKGSIGLRHASVRLDSSEKNKFAVKTPSTKFFLKATHPAETNKWVWALQRAITEVRDSARAGTTGTATGTAQAVTGASATTAQGASATTPGTSTTPSNATPANTATPATSIPSSAHHSHHTHTPLSHTRTRSISQSSRVSGPIGSPLFVNDIQQKGESDSDDDDEDEALEGPLITAESLVARMSAIKDLMGMLVFQIQDDAMRDAISTAQGSIDVLNSDIAMFERQEKAQLKRAKQQLDKSENNQMQWARNYRDLEIQYEKLEGQLYSLKPREQDEDEFFDAMDNAPVQQDNTPAAVGAAVAAASARSRSASASGGASESASVKESKEVPEVSTKPTKEPKESTVPASTAPTTAPKESTAPTAPTASKPAKPAAPVPPLKPFAANAPGDNDDQYSTPPPPVAIDETTLTSAQKEVVDKIEQQNTFAGYEQGPRQRLKIDADKRPRLSLWGILKNLIGKDMTKMTLPVTFNECTSLLQRSAEDMEYTELLDLAAEAVDDPGLRMVYVAAFAGSSYSSTINRVAKPFNPLLGETYEYARPDKGYRLFAEQVSHHPPIGALIAESRHWDFYGESNVESHFYGRSFDINPLGLWYLNLRPNKGAEVESELYSFRKITSSVVGIMLGNPVVDNYGDMEITNHTLGLKAIVTYKARGWRGASAYKLQGKVMDKNNKELWTIGGQWDNKMYGMKTGSDSKILLWTAHPRHKTPFNLTDFAVTLNALPSKLRPWLPPTDTRLRPDQRAMEEGRYDDASDDKHRVEEKQRAARREREAKGEEYKPKWFELVPHPVTGKNYYKPIGDYWAKRGSGELPEKPEIF